MAASSEIGIKTGRRRVEEETGLGDKKVVIIVKLFNLVRIDS
jgi:hypothetical protein